MKRLRTLIAILGVLVGAGGAACSTGTSATSHTQESGTVVAEPAPSGTKAVAAAKPAAKKLGTPQPKLPVGKVVLETAPRAPIVLDVEVASTDPQRQMGLMFRETMRDDEGMLFLFPTERHNSFWMHNTLLPLDMFFIDSEWNVVGVVENATPQTDDPRAVPNMSQYVLEVNAGFAARNGLGAGTQVRFTPPSETSP